MSSSLPADLWPHVKLTLFYGDPDRQPFRHADPMEWRLIATAPSSYRYSGLIDTDGTWFQYDPARDVYVADDGTVFDDERPLGGPESRAASSAAYSSATNRETAF